MNPVVRIESRSQGRKRPAVVGAEIDSPHGRWGVGAKVGAVAASFVVLLLASCRTRIAPPTSTGSLPAEQRAPGIGAARGVEFFLESEEPGADVMELPQSLVHIPVRSQPVLVAADVKSVQVVPSEFGKAVEVIFTPAAARELERVSTAAGRRRLVLVVNHVPLGALRLSGPITSGEISVFLEVPDAYLPRLLTNLKEEGVPVVGAAP